MIDEAWRDELSMMLWRCSGLGIGCDVGAMSLIELWGIYCLLKRLTGA